MVGPGIALVLIHLGGDGRRETDLATLPIVEERLVVLLPLAVAAPVAQIKHMAFFGVEGVADVKEGEFHPVFQHSPALGHHRIGAKTDEGAAVHRVEVLGKSRDLQLAQQFGLAGGGKIQHKERVHLPEGDNIGDVPHVAD